MRVATLVIIVRDGRVLLGHKKKGVEEISNILNGPGGKQEPGETLVECAVRETQDELGIQLLPDKLKKVAVITFFAAAQPDFEVHVFWTDYFKGEPCETAVMVPYWFPIDAIPYDRMLEGDRCWFAQAVAGEKFAAHIYYERRAEGFIGMVPQRFPDE